MKKCPYCRAEITSFDVGDFKETYSPGPIPAPPDAPMNAPMNASMSETVKASVASTATTVTTTVTGTLSAAIDASLASAKSYANRGALSVATKSEEGLHKINDLEIEALSTKPGLVLVASGLVFPQVFTAIAVTRITTATLERGAAKAKGYFSAQSKTK
jgi:hypothetical protein